MQTKKRLRKFIVEKRVLPSKTARLFGQESSGWVFLNAFERIVDARNVMPPSSSPGFFTLGTEYRVRRTDTPAP